VTESPSASPTAGSGPESVDIQIVFSGWIASEKVLEVSGYTDSVVESGGTCTLRAEGPGGPIVVSHDAMDDRTVTTCGTLDIPGAKLVTGEYLVTLTYASAKHSGSSAPMKVQVTK
jgi:hypothetical protein